MNNRLHKHLLDAVQAVIEFIGDRQVHGYDTVDDEIVFDTARADLPGLLRDLESLLSAAPPPAA